MANLESHYPANSQEVLSQLQKDSFWFRHRLDVVLSLISTLNTREVIDLGAGSGYVSKALFDLGFNITAVENDPSGLQAIKRSGIQQIVVSDIYQYLQTHDELTHVLLLDVIEHFKDDGELLMRLNKKLRPNSKLILTVPALNILWSHEDQFAGHYRRYNKTTLSKVLKESGFQIEFISYMFFPLPLPIFLFRSIPSWLGSKTSNWTREHNPQKSILTRLMEFSLNWELKNFKKRKSIPIGSSLVAVASRS